MPSGSSHLPKAPRPSGLPRFGRRFRSSPLSLFCGSLQRLRAEKELVLSIVPPKLRWSSWQKTTSYVPPVAARAAQGTGAEPIDDGSTTGVLDLSRLTGRTPERLRPHSSRRRSERRRRSDWLGGAFDPELLGRWWACSGASTSSRRLRLGRGALTALLPYIRLVLRDGLPSLPSCGGSEGLTSRALPSPAMANFGRPSRATSSGEPEREIGPSASSHATRNRDDASGAREGTFAPCPESRQLGEHT